MQTVIHNISGRVASIEIDTVTVVFVEFVINITFSLSPRPK